MNTKLGLKLLDLSTIRDLLMRILANVYGACFQLVVYHRHQSSIAHILYGNGGGWLMPHHLSYCIQFLHLEKSWKCLIIAALYLGQQFAEVTSLDTSKSDNDTCKLELCLPRPDVRGLGSHLTLLIAIQKIFMLFYERSILLRFTIHQG